MLSGVISSQASSLAAMTTNVVSVSRVAMPTLGGKLPSALTEGLFVGLPSVGMPSTSAETAAANGKWLTDWHLFIKTWQNAKLLEYVGV